MVYVDECLLGSDLIVVLGFSYELLYLGMGLFGWWLSVACVYWGCLGLLYLFCCYNCRFG